MIAALPPNTLNEGFFGGHLLRMFPTDTVIVLQDELTCLLAALVFPDCICISIRHNGNLTKEHIRILQGRNAVLLPDSMAVDFWQKIPHDANIKVLDTLSEVEDIRQFLISHIDNEGKRKFTQKFNIIRRAVEEQMLRLLPTLMEVCKGNVDKVLYLFSNYKKYSDTYYKENETVMKR